MWKDEREFAGGPPSARARVTFWLAPRGRTVTDGARLAVVNAAGIVAALLLVALVSLLTRALRLLVPLPFWFSGLLVALLFVVGLLFVWYRYATSYGRRARASGREVRADLFGGIAALPFVAVAVVLIGSGLFGLFLSVLTLSASRAGDALQRVGLALLFLVLAAGNVIVARAASE